jgi:hypothetical protein
MILAIWNGGEPTIVGNHKRVRLPDGNIVIGARPEPGRDLYEFVERVAKPGPYQQVTGMEYRKAGSKIFGTQTLEWIPVEDARQRKINELEQMERDLLRDSEWAFLSEVEWDRIEATGTDRQTVSRVRDVILDDSAAAYRRDVRIAGAMARKAVRSANSTAELAAIGIGTGSLEGLRNDE